jgi:hypothetical protein
VSLLREIKKIYYSKIADPMIIVKMDGGLGSQMRQWAIGRLAGRYSGLPVLYDLSWFDLCGMDLLGLNKRSYQLENVFKKIQLEKANPELAKFFRRHFSWKGGGSISIYDQEMLESKRTRYLGAYYTNELYLTAQGDELRDIFEFSLSLDDKNRRLASYINKENCPVALHIRRGDFLCVPEMKMPSLNYFVNAINFVSNRTQGENPKFFVFSNDMEWCKKSLASIDKDIVFVDHNDEEHGAFDMYLMSLCRHFIISNSGFGSWPAWLSRRSADKIAVRPDVSVKASEGDFDQLCPRDDGWYVLPAGNA